MEQAFTISGGGLLMRDYQMDAAAINTGVPVQSQGDVANTEGCIAATETVLVNALGVSIDQNRTASSDAQVAAGAGDLSDGNNASFVKVICNPDAVYRAKISGGATEDTAITIIVQTAEDTTGLAPTTVTDEAVIWGYQGANVGHNRQADAANSVEQAFPFTIAANDEFLQAILMIGAPSQTPTLTAAFTQVDATGAVAASDNFITLDWELGVRSDDPIGTTNSFVMMVIQDHAFGNQGVV